MSTMHEQAWDAATGRFGGDDPRVEQRRADWKDGFLAGHKAASRPRQVTTVAELDALPVGSVVLSEQGAVFERLNEAHWSETGFTWKPQSEDITTPARVLYVPEEES